MYAYLNEWNCSIFITLTVSVAASPSPSCAFLEAENNRYWEASTCIYKMFCTTFGYLIDVPLNQITIVEIVFNFLNSYLMFQTISFFKNTYTLYSSIFFS